MINTPPEPFFCGRIERGRESARSRVGSRLMSVISIPLTSPNGDDPLFPATNTRVGASRNFEASGLRREHCRSAHRSEKSSEAFLRAGLRYFNPHSLRSTLVQLAETRCRIPRSTRHGVRISDTNAS